MEEETGNRIDLLILKYLQGNVSVDEAGEVEKWISESAENRSQYLYLKNIWNSAIDLPVSTEIALQKVINRTAKKRTSFLFFLQRAAAILFLPVLIALLWLTITRQAEQRHLKGSYNTVSAAFGSFSSFELSDGSKVWLNSGSQLRYPEIFSEDNREVFLQGEGYFEVKSDTKSPFFVHTPDFSVKATGTRFNVNTNRNRTFASVTLVEGRVSIEKLSGRSMETIACLNPGQNMKYDSMLHKPVITDVETYKYIAWKDGKLVFRNDPLSEVVRVISLQYNVDIQIEGEKISKYRYRATFANQPLIELLELLKMSAPIDYKEIPPVALPDHSFSKRKIIIYSTDVD